MWGFVRRHPVVSAVVIACTLAGAVLGGLLLTPEWPIWRRVLAGVVAGAGTGFLVTATKLYG